MTYDAGDIVRVRLDPTIGTEMKGDFRPCLVISSNRFNQVTGLTLVAPITQSNHNRHAGFAVELEDCGKTEGRVMVNAVRTLDLNKRKSKLIEKAPDFVLDDVKAKLKAIIE